MFQPRNDHRAQTLGPTLNNRMPATWLTVCGWVLVASGLLHVIPWLVTGTFGAGTQWEGAISWRKPILFGISTGMTMISLGWVATLVDPRRRDAWILPATSVALLVEVGFISIQQWRGVASHFNTNTAFDSAIDYTITVLISFAALVIVDLTLRTLGTLRCNSDNQLAIRCGMWFLVVSCGIGFGILLLGQYQLSQGGSAETYGRRGALKFPHGIAIHAIQFLPFVVLTLRRISVPMPKRLHAIAWFSGAISTLLLFGLFQTFSGRGRVELTTGSTLILIAAFAQCLPLIVAIVSHLKFIWGGEAATQPRRSTDLN